MNRGDTRAQWAVVAVIVGTLLLSGPAGGIDFASERPSLDEGTASLQVVAPEEGPIPITEGRFGTGVSYVRIPDLVVNVTDVEGTPRISYAVTIPELGIEKRQYRLVQSTGRLTLPLSDRALPTSRATDAEARLVVRVQSFSGQETVLNRTVEVRDER